jgi:hypothetical protein
MGDDDRWALTAEKDYGRVLPWAAAWFFALVAGWVGARVMRGSAQVGLCLGILEKTRKCRYCDGVYIRGLCSVL